MEHPMTAVFGGQDVRITMVDGEPWFVARDICAILELDNVSRAVETLASHQKGVTVSNTLGGPQEMVIINKSGLYKLIFKSRKEAAVAFTDWVTDEVLPSIEKTGRYAVDPYYRDWDGQIDRYDRDNMRVALGFLGVTLASDGRAHPGRSGRRQEWVLNWRGNPCLPLTKEIRRELVAEMAAKLLYHPSNLIVKEAMEILLDKNRYDPTTKQLFVDGAPSGGNLFRFVPRDHHRHLGNRVVPMAPVSAA